MVKILGHGDQGQEQSSLEAVVGLGIVKRSFVIGHLADAIFEL
jgi:hypothetical protein